MEGPAAEVLERVSVYPHVLILSTAILEELHRILHYPRLRRFHKLSDAAIGRFIAKLQRVARLVDAAPDEGGGLEDPADAAVVGAAVAGRADAICTLDRHFDEDKVREYCRGRMIEIMDDVKLLARLQKLDEGAGPL